MRIRIPVYALWMLCVCAGAFAQSPKRPVATAGPASCSVLILGKTFSKLTLAEVKTIDSLEVTPGFNLEVVAYDLFVVTANGLVEVLCQGKRLNPSAKAAMQRVVPGKKIMLENIRARNRQTGKVSVLPDFKFTVVP